MRVRGASQQMDIRERGKDEEDRDAPVTLPI